MKKGNIAVSVAILSMVATNVMAGECEQNFKLVDVSGTVNTQSIPAAMQIGTIDMQLTSVKSGRVLFDQTGAVVGKITGSVDGAFPPVVLLDHDITFEKGAEIETTGDQATLYGDPTGSEPVPVVEVISNFWGSKMFKNSTGEIIATGYLNTNGTGSNEFGLSGSLCVKP
ncbi:MAG: hypothetical protein V7709_09375 [Halioglobus sp.]